MDPIDLRSDTVTKPTDEMYAAMAGARLGDDGWHDDPTVAELEDLAATLLGKEAAIFVPTGTMSNLLALITHTGRGGEIVTESTSHVIRSEMGGIASLAGLFHKAVPGEKGAIDIDLLRDVLRPKLASRNLQTALICLENTHNAAGGTVIPIEHMREVRALSLEHGVPVHLDGARLFNAVAATGIPAIEYGALCDSITVCLSKGLSAPIGSLLIGSKKFIERARPFRKMLGGTMRQVGVIASAGIVALEKMRDRLADDHESAKALAAGLSQVNATLVTPDDVVTNIVMVDTRAKPGAASRIVTAMEKQGVLASASRSDQIRLVTHRHIDREDVAKAVHTFADCFAAC